MLVLGHAGLTLGAATLLSTALRNKHFSTDSQDNKVPWFASLGSRMDTRLLLVGALLPDIIDKPVGLFFLREIFDHGRLFSHTLLFFTLVALAGLYLYLRHNRGWMLVLAFGTFTHLLFDQMWLTPTTLFWPFFGFAFGKGDPAGWVTGILHALLTNPEVYVPELVGAAILLWFGLALVRRRKVRAFIRYGQS